TVFYRPLPPLAAQSPEVILATTTSTRDAGLLDSLLPVFERETRYHVKVIAVGSGQALAMGRRGDADVVLSHAPEAERVLVDSGYFVRRRLVMHNEFLVVGPATDPAGLRGLSDAVAAFRRLAERRAPFVARRSVGHAPARAAAVEAHRHDRGPPPRRLVRRVGPGHGGDPAARRRKARLHPHRSGDLSRLARQAAARAHGRGRFAAVQRLS